MTLSVTATIDVTITVTVTIDSAVAIAVTSSSVPAEAWSCRRWTFPSPASTLQLLALRK